MSDFINWFTNIISQLGNWSYALMALICFLEALPIIGFFIPMVIALLLAGFLIANSGFNFSSLLIICALASLLGDFLAFYLGRHFSKSFKKEHKILKEEYLTKASVFMQRRGVLSVFWGRFIGPLRPMICFVAGTTRLSWFSFILPALTSSFLFVLIYLSLGYVAGSAWQTVTTWSSRLAVIIASLVIIILALGWLGEFIFKRGRQLGLMLISLLRTAYSSLQEKKFWQIFSNKYPRFSSFFSKRINPNNWFGLVLSLLIFLEIILAIIIFFMSRSFLSLTNFFSGFDLRVHNVITLFSEIHLATGFFFITTLGSFLVLITICVLVIVWLFLEKRWSYIIGFLISVLGGSLSSSLIKYLVARPRPIPTFYFENSYAFPSGHATVAITLFLFLTYYAIRAYPRWSRNVGLVLTTSLLILLIGFSRLYLGVHFFSDVIGGYLLGLFWFILAVIISRFLEKNDQPKRLKKSTQISLLASFTVLILIVFGTQVFGSSTFNNIKHYSLTNSITIKNNNFNNLNFVSENLGGNAWRPLEFILSGREAIIKQALTTTGWTERVEATIPTLIQRGLALTFKTPFSEAPLRPRFWNNETNLLTFTKQAKVVKKNVTYVFRLWLMASDNNEANYIGEVSVSQGLSFNANQKELVLGQAVLDLANDLKTSKFLNKYSTINVSAKLDEDAKQASEFKVYVFSFKN